MSTTTSTVPPLHAPTVALPELMNAMRARRGIVVDVLSPESFRRQHLPGALNLPVADIPNRAAEVLPDRAASIVVYCGGPT